MNKINDDGDGSAGAGQTSQTSSLIFTYNTSPSRIIFGPGRLSELGIELDRLGIQRAFVVSTQGRVQLADAVVHQLGDRTGGLYAQAVMHTPVAVTAEALARLKNLACDGLVSLGGGSAIGLGKALAFRTDL